MAVCLLLTGVVLAVKMVVVAPGAILTKAGTVTDAALLERANSADEEEAALTDTVQVEEAPPITSLGAQLSEKMDGASVGGIIAPPVPVTVKAPPDGEAPTRFNKPIEVVEAVGASLKVTLAIKPLGMMLLFMPASRARTSRMTVRRKWFFPRWLTWPPRLHLRRLWRMSGSPGSIE